MQQKKDEVFNALITEGEKEFLAKGYQQASLRKIVKNANTTLGNFYNYFSNKEAFFDELVRPEWNKFNSFFNEHEKLEHADYLWDVTDIGEWRRVLGQMVKGLFPRFSSGFILLIEGSMGTKYENVRNEIIEILKG
ncbi:MAG: TetR/AcrR family transcriptional regulator, partial [Spirochaetales bacterium]|nr:TetR/AcrR family transcriptional regulator [Spirochaetales bacterium]